MQAFVLTGVNTCYGFIQMYKFVQCSCTCAFDCEITWPSLGKSVKRMRIFTKACNISDNE